MNNFYRYGGMLTAWFLSFSVYAADIQIQGAWTRATAPGQDAASVDMTITSKQEATLVGVSSPVASSAEMHSMTTENGMMKMREVHSIKLPAGKPVNLGKSGYHLMLNELKSPLKEGNAIPLTLSIKVGKQELVKMEQKVDVRSLTATQAQPRQDEHMHMNMDMR